MPVRAEYAFEHGVDRHVLENMCWDSNELASTPYARGLAADIEVPRPSVPVLIFVTSSTESRDPWGDSEDLDCGALIAHV
jgi:hypothetical protein